LVRSPPTAGRVRFSSVFTRGVDRGRGYAAALVGALTADTLAMSGVHGVILLVDSLNHSARRLYERLGYEARGELARYERLPTT
jgi:predicted GNAT family acetyltransferase